VHSGHLLGEGDPWLFGKAGVMGFFTWGRLGMDVPRTIYCVSPQTYRVVSVKKSWDGGGRLFGWQPTVPSLRMQYMQPEFTRGAPISQLETRTQSVARKQINKTYGQLEQQKRNKSSRIRSPLHQL